MAARQTSIISATAPPAPALIANAEADPVAPTIPVAFTTPVPTHDGFVTCTVCSCQFACVVETIPFCSCRPQQSKSTDHGNNSQPAHSVRPRLALWNLRAKTARVLFRTLERRLFQQRPFGKLSSFRFFCKSLPSRAIAASCVSFTRSNSMLRLSASSGTSAVTGITCLAVSLTYLAASLTDTPHVPEFSSISRSCSQRQSDVSHRLTLGVSIA